MAAKIPATHSVLRKTTSCTLLAMLFALAAAGCAHHQSENGLTPVALQTDWYPQPEHGGFYDALIKGYYKDEGLDVEIVPGGPYVSAEQQVSVGSAQFAMGSSDLLMEGVSNGEPIIAVAATMQHDPQGVMVHEQSSVKSLADLGGHAIAVKTGAIWFRYLVKRYQLKDVREIPATYSVANFIHDPDYIQQVFVTSEPFFARQAGADCRTILISSVGYDPYRIFFTSRNFLDQHPEVVAKFVRASLRGWRDYMNDPTAVNAEISKLNPAMSTDLMQFTWKALQDGHFVENASGDDLGQFDPVRWSTMYRQLHDLGVIQKPIDPAGTFTLRFLQNTNK
jgi:NitT/TauT family transport system substrate-binding protein